LSSNLYKLIKFLPEVIPVSFIVNVKISWLISNCGNTSIEYEPPNRYVGAMTDIEITVISIIEATLQSIILFSEPNYPKNSRKFFTDCIFADFMKWSFLKSNK
jgi:hypothetical protein